MEEVKVKDQPSCTLSDKDLLEKCEKWIIELAESGGKAWTLRVPVDFNHDPDMLFTELMNRYKSRLVAFWYSEKQDKVINGTGFVDLLFGVSVQKKPKFKGQYYTECRGASNGKPNWDDAVLIGYGDYNDVTFDS